LLVVEFSGLAIKDVWLYSADTTEDLFVIQRPDQEKRTGTAIELNEFNGDVVNKRNKPSNKTDVITNRSSVVSAEYSHTSFMASPENSTTSKNYAV
jgi:hypothetical protein